MADQPTAADALKKLEPLVGRWRLLARGPTGEPWPGEGQASFSWHDSGAHLVARASVDLPGAPFTLSIIGCDAANDTYFQLYSDDRGVSRVYEMSISGREWKLWRAGEPFAQRFTGTIADDGSRIDARWEKADDGTNYAIDFYLTYIRAD